MNNHSFSSQHTGTKSAIPSTHILLPALTSISNTAGVSIEPAGSQTLPHLLALPQQHHQQDNPRHPHNNQQYLHSNQQHSHSSQQHPYNNQNNQQHHYNNQNNQQHHYNHQNKYQNSQQHQCHNQNNYQNSQQHQYSDQDISLFSSQSHHPLHNTSKSQTQEQSRATPSNGDTQLSSFEPLPLLTLLSQPTSTQQGPAVDLHSATHAPGLQSPALTPNISSSTLSNSTGTTEVLVRAFCPLSPPLAASKQASVSLLPSSTVTKRSAEAAYAPRTVKRARLIKEEGDEDNVDDENDWEDDDEEDGGDEEEEEEEEEELMVGMEGYEKKLKTRDDCRFADWIAGKLNEPDVYTALQSRNSGTRKKTPKAEVNRRIVSAFNKHPPTSIISFNKITETQVKNKIDKIKKAFKAAHALRNSSGFGSQNGEGWRKRVKKKCRHYFILERNWSKAWTEDVPLYTDSLSNMDDATITDDLPRRLQKGKEREVGFTREETDDNTLDLTQEDDNLMAESLYEEEDLETYLRNRSTGPSRSALEAATAAVASMSAARGSSRSATPGPSRSALATAVAAHKAITSTIGVASTDSQPSSSKTSNRDASKSAPGGAGHKDFGQLFLKGLEEEQKSQREKINLKREQFEFLKKDTEEKNTIELKRIELEAKRIEQEGKKLQMDHDFRLAQLKYESDLQLKSMTLNAELRNRGREPFPVSRIQSTPPPTTTSPPRSPPRSPSKPLYVI